MNDDLLERLGQLVDTVENYMAGMTMNLPLDGRVRTDKFALEDIRNKLKKIYFDEGGEDVWTLGDYEY